MNQGKKDGLEKPSEDAKATSGSLSREDDSLALIPLESLVQCLTLPSHNTSGSLYPSIAPSGFGVWLSGEGCQRRGMSLLPVLLVL
jgi:hypothetical protein